MKSSPSFWISQVIGAILLCPPDVIERRIPMIAPFPSTIREFEARMEVDKILNKCWENPDAGYEIQPTDEWIVNNQEQSRSSFDILEQDDSIEFAAVASMGRPSTYGEITALGARQLFGAMGLLDNPKGSKEQLQKNSSIHFFDLGSGTGKLVGQAVLELPNNSLSRATGIELSPSRHDSALRAKEALLELTSTSGLSFDQEYGYGAQNDDVSDIFVLEENVNKLELLQGDLFDSDLSTATHIYVASLCFPNELMVRLEERLKALIQQQETASERDGAQNSVLEWVATLQPFPNNLGGISPVVRFMEMSWTKPLGCVVYLYKCNDSNI